MRVILFLATMTFAAVAHADEAASPGNTEHVVRAPVPVRAVNVKPAPSTADIRAAGTLTLKREMGLSFKIAGIVEKFHVDVGDAVKKDQVLAQLVQTEIDARNSEVNANLAKAQRDYARIAPLAAKGTVSRQRLDDAQSALDAARARSKQVGFDRSWATIVAPSDGVVLTRSAETNEIVQPGQQVLAVGDGTSGLILTVALSDRDIVRVVSGDKAMVSFSALDAPVAAHVSRMAGKSDPRTGAFDVELTIDDTTVGLLSGMIGDATITPTRNLASNYLSIPTESILEGEGETGSVFRVDAKTNVAHRVEVQLVGLSGDVVLVSSGLNLGDLVVSSGATFLRDGDTVDIVTDQELAAR